MQTPRLIAPTDDANVTARHLPAAHSPSFRQTTSCFVPHAPEQEVSTNSASESVGGHVLPARRSAVVVRQQTFAMMPSEQVDAPLQRSAFSFELQNVPSGRQVDVPLPMQQESLGAHAGDAFGQATVLALGMSTGQGNHAGVPPSDAASGAAESAPGAASTGGPPPSEDPPSGLFGSGWA